MPLSLMFSINWRITLFSLTFLPILIGLGVWQLSRAEEKREWLLVWEQQQIKPPVTVERLTDIELAPHARIELEAQLNAETFWLLEGRIYRGEPGYEVLMPASLASGETIIVNRGWVSANQDRRLLPEISTSSIRQRFWGELREPTQTALVDEKDNPLQRWPHRILEADIAVMSEQLGLELAPLVFTLAVDHPQAFVIQPSRLNMSPEKHHGYALQWFGMAIVLAVLWFCTNTNLLSLIKQKR